MFWEIQPYQSVSSMTGALVGGTYHILPQLHFLHVAVVRLAVGQLPQLQRRPLVQLAADLVVLAPVRKVVRREASVVLAVDLCAEVKEAAD